MSAGYPQLKRRTPQRLVTHSLTQAAINPHSHISTYLPYCVHSIQRYAHAPAHTHTHTHTHPPELHFYCTFHIRPHTYESVLSLKPYSHTPRHTSPEPIRTRVTTMPARQVLRFAVVTNGLCVCVCVYARGRKMFDCVRDRSPAHCGPSSRRD